MNFTEIGVKSRKTGLTVKSNVRRDEHNMEDLDDFFQDDDERTLVTKEAKLSANRGGAKDAATSAKMTFNDVSPREGGLLRSPLNRSSSIGRSLLKSNQTDDDDVFDDALENPEPQESTRALGSGSMDIDDESRGSIREVNDIDVFTQPTQPMDQTSSPNFDMSFHDDDMLPIEADVNQSPSPLLRNSEYPNIDPRLNTVRGQKLFVSDSDEESGKSLSQRQRELERNTTVRSESRRRTQTGKGTGTITPPMLSPQRNGPSKLYSPLQVRPSETSTISSRMISKISRSIATNDRDRTTKLSSNINNKHRVYHDGDDEVSDSVDVDFEAANSKPVEAPVKRKRGRPRKNPEDKKSTVKKSDTKEKTVKVPGKRGRPRKVIPPADDDEDYEGVQEESITHKRGRERSRKEQPLSPSLSPVSKERRIDVETLRKEQISRSSSRPHSPSLRRSDRVRVPPLAFWRNEREVFVKKPGERLPSLSEIIRVNPPREFVRSRAPSRSSSRPPSHIRGRNSKRPTVRSLTSRRPSLSRLTSRHNSDDEDDEDDDELAVGNGEVNGSEWIRQGFLKVDTFEGHGSDARSNRLIAWAPGTEAYSNPIVDGTDNFKLAILFDKNREFIATGMMSIPPGGMKSLKSTDTTYFVFYCVSGILEVTLSGSIFLIKKGCSLEVPMGNFYQFENKGKKDATLFFVQTRGQEAEWDE